MRVPGAVSATALALLAIAGCGRPLADTAPGEASGTTSTVVPETSPNAPAVSQLGKASATKPSSAVAETIITGKIKAAIAADPGMKGSDISVSTNDGVVSLSGLAASPEQVMIAANLAQRQEGVSRVETSVLVR
ncbi:MAG TPA: BON domain-containing protein [Usitatibacter sp.]|nr:BON domain-containing protein [Usitatibacter sp.]